MDSVIFLIHTTDYLSDKWLDETAWGQTYTHPKNSPHVLIIWDGEYIYGNEDLF